MALDMSAIQAKLSKLEKTSNRTNSLWRPEAGDTQIRLLPYPHGTDPFIELYFCYNIGKTRSILSPLSFGKECPINEAAAALRSTGKKEDFELARKVQPKLRIYAPIIVRGKEAEGVKFWGFGKTVYQSLLNYFLDADYGDLSDPNSGRDVVVKFTPPSGTMAFGATTIMPKPNKTTLLGTPDESQKLVDSIPHINDVFEEKTFDEVNRVWNAFLNDSDDSTGSTQTTTDGLGSEKTFSTTTASAPAPAATAEATDLQKDLDKQFDDVFGD